MGGCWGWEATGGQLGSRARLKQVPKREMAQQLQGPIQPCPLPGCARVTWGTGPTQAEVGAASLEQQCLVPLGKSRGHGAGQAVVGKMGAPGTGGQPSRTRTAHFRNLRMFAETSRAVGLREEGRTWLLDVGKRGREERGRGRAREDTATFYTEKFGGFLLQQGL